MINKNPDEFLAEIIKEHRKDERSLILKDMFMLVNSIELPIETSGGSIQEACRRTILKAIWDYDKRKRGK